VEGLGKKIVAEWQRHVTPVSQDLLRCYSALNPTLTDFVLFCDDEMTSDEELTSDSDTHQIPWEELDSDASTLSSDSDSPDGGE
jgi:hypothetical protein